jgi:hypothetical protein
VFSVGESPSLGNLGMKFVCLFLGTEVLSVRKVAKLFSGKVSGNQSLERRLYLAVSFLEAVNVIEHTPKASEYRLIINKADMIEKGMQQRKNHFPLKSIGSIENLLSKYDEGFIERLYIQRRAELPKFWFD